LLARRIEQIGRRNEVMFGQMKIVEVENATKVECPETKRKLVVTDENAVELSGTLFVTSAHAAALKSVTNGRKTTQKHE
jgi:tRNA threonylcarbamoyladenosine modification (KEOPS) complex Cgi121 subunit